MGELFPRVDFIVTNLPLSNRAVVRFYSKRGTAEQWIKEGKQAAHWTRLSCHRFRANEIRAASERARLQRRASLVAAGAPEAHRALVIDQSPAAPRQDRRALGETRALLLAVAGGEPPDPTPVRVDATTDLGALGADRLTGESRRGPSGQTAGRNAGEVFEKCSGVMSLPARSAVMGTPLPAHKPTAKIFGRRARC